MGGYPWLWGDRSSYSSASLNAEGRWPNFLYAWMGVFGVNQEPNHAPPEWWRTAGLDQAAQGEYVNVPVAFLNSRQEQRQRNLTQWLPRDESAAQAAALQKALADSLRAAQTGK